MSAVMNQNQNNLIAYVVKRYPRYSETFIVNEILAHEAAGQALEIYSLRAPTDTHFQDAIARVRARVNYLSHATPKTKVFWQTLLSANEILPGLWKKLETLRDITEKEIYQALLLAMDLKQKGVTHVHAHFASQATSIARLAASFTDLPFSFTAHAKDIFHESVSHDDLRLKLQQAAFTITVSDYNLAFLQQHFGTQAARVLRIFNGLDLERFPYQSPAQRPAHIVAVGRLVEKKGFADLVTACALLRERKIEFSCAIIGGGELEDTLRAQVRDLQLEEQVAILGPRPQQELAHYIQKAAVMAAPCVVGDDGNRDGLPTVILEAMALGTPVISTDVTGIPEVLHQEITGLQVPQRDPVSLADALQRLLQDDALRVQLAQAARQRMEQDFDIHRNTAILRERFRAALAPYDQAQGVA